MWLTVEFRLFGVRVPPPAPNSADRLGPNGGQPWVTNVGGLALHGFGDPSSILLLLLLLPPIFEF